MSEFLPSELARLILGYFESKGYTKTVETMLSELPELAEVAQRKKKGQKMNLKVGDLSLTDILDDYCLSKEIVYENITNYRSTFSSVKKFQALAEQVRSVIEIALRSKTFKFYPKNLYRSKHYVQSSLSQPNSVLSNEMDLLECEVNDCGEARLDVDTTPESSLPGSSKRDTCIQESPSYSSQPTSFDGRDQLAPEITPQKRKGSLRKKGQPSPKVQPQPTKQIDAEERMEKLFKNLLENKELHTKIADSINNTLLVSNPLSQSRGDPEAIHNENLLPSVTCSSTSQGQWFDSDIRCQEEISAALKPNSLPDSVISNISLQVTNDPIMAPILASIDYDLQGSLAQPHRQLTTPVPHLLTFSNSSFSNSELNVQSSSCQISQLESQSSHFDMNQPTFNDRGTYRVHNTSVSSDMMLEECFSPSQSVRNQNLTLVECFRSQDNPEDNIQAQNLIVHQDDRRQTVSDTPYSLALGECFRKSDGHTPDKSLNLTLVECYRSEAGCQEEAQNLSVKKCFSQDQDHPDEVPGNPPSTQHSRHSDDQENLNDVTKDVLPELQNAKHRDSETAINSDLLCENNFKLRNEAPVKRNSFSFGEKVFRDETASQMSSGRDSDQVRCSDSFSGAAGHFSGCDEPLDLTRLSSDSIKNINPFREPPIHDGVPQIASIDDVCENHNEGGEPSQKLCPDTPQQDYSMPSSFSPFRPPSVRAVPVTISNDSFANAKYFSGTPDHPNNYTITELLPLPPATPQRCLEGTETMSPPSPLIVPLSPVTFSSQHKIMSVETTVAEEHSGLKLISIRLNNDEPTVLVKIPSCEGKSSVNLESVEPPKELDEAPQNFEEPSRQRKKSERIRRERNYKLDKKSSRLRDKGVESNKEATKVPKRGKKRDLSNAFSVDSDNATTKRTVQKKRKISSRGLISTDKATNVPGNITLAEDLATHLHDSNSLQEVSSEILKRIPNMSAMEDLVDELESSDTTDRSIDAQVDISKDNERDGSEALNNVGSHSTKSLSPQLMSLVSFSKSFVLNNNFAVTVKSPSSSERITVYRGSLSTPRNKNSHIRVLDFNTPNKRLSSRKKSPTAKANLQFSPFSSSKRPRRKLHGFDKRIRTQSLTVSPSVKAPLLAILETSKEAMDLSTVADQSIDLENQDNDTSINEANFLLPENETCVVDSSDKFLLPNKQLSSIKKLRSSSFLQTPGKMSTLCLEPTTPFLVTRSVVALSETTGTELNTPVPIVVVDDMTSPAPSLKSSHESFSVNSEENYYQPSERSLADCSLASSSDDIETVLIRTAQQSEKELAEQHKSEKELAEQHKHNTCIENVDVEDQELPLMKKQSDPRCGDTKKGKTKDKSTKLSNKELGELVEKEMEKLEQMQSLKESHREKWEANGEQVDQGNTSIETYQHHYQQFVTASKSTTRITVADKCKRRDTDITKNSRSHKNLPLYETTEELCYEHFDCDFELLKASTIEILESSHIDSSKKLLGSLLDVFEKEKFSASNLEQQKKVDFMLKIINFYSSPEMLQNLTQSRESHFRCAESENRKSSSPIRPSYERADKGLKSEWNYMPRKSCKSNEKSKRKKTGINYADLGVMSDAEEDGPRGVRNVLTLTPSQENISPPQNFNDEGEHESSSARENGSSAEKQREVQETSSESISHNSSKSSNSVRSQKSSAFTYWGKEAQFKSTLGLLGTTETATVAIDGDLDCSSDSSKDAENLNSSGNKSLKSPTVQLMEKSDSTARETSPFRDLERQEESFVSENDEYSLIERQLAALDGSVTDSPSIRAELTSNVMDDENISVMFTPSSRTPEERGLFRFDAGKKNPNSLMAFSILPGTPEKRVQEICQSVVKNKVAMVAIPSVRMEPELGQRRKRLKENRSTKSRRKTLQHNVSREISSGCDNMECINDDVADVASSSLRKAEQSMSDCCALSFSDYIELFSLNLGSDEMRLKGEVELPHPKIKSNKISQKRNKSPQKREKKKNESQNSILEDLLRKNSRKKSRNNLKCEVTNVPPSSSRKLEFVKSRKSEEEKVRRKATKENNFKQEESRKNIPRKSRNRNIASEDLPLLSPQGKSSPNINYFEKGSKRKNSANKELNPGMGKNVAFDDTASLMELHLSSSDSDEDREEHCSTLSPGSSLSPKKIRKSLMEGATFELSETPKKMQTVISKYPNQDSFFHFNEESMLSIPPTPGKHLFLPVIPITDGLRMPDAGFMSQPDYLQKCGSSGYAENETNPRYNNPVLDKRKYAPRTSNMTVEPEEVATVRQRILTSKQNATSQGADKCIAENSASNPQVPVVVDDSLTCEEDRLYKHRVNSPDKKFKSKETSETYLPAKKRNEMYAASPSSQTKRYCRISPMPSDHDVRSRDRFQDLFGPCESLLDQPSDNEEESDGKAAIALKGKAVKGTSPKKKNATPESSPIRTKKVEKIVSLTDKETKNLKSLLQFIHTSK